MATGDQFTAYFAHDLVAGEFYRLPELFADAWPPDGEDDWRQPTRWGTPDIMSWPWDVVSADGCIPFEGPAELRGMVGPRLVALAHPTPWSEFEGRTSIRGQLRSSCRSLARVLGSHRWVYVCSSIDPIELVTGGADFAELSRWLSTRHRPDASYELVSA